MPEDKKTAGIRITLSEDVTREYLQVRHLVGVSDAKLRRLITSYINNQLTGEIASILMKNIQDKLGSEIPKV